jgi:phosphatidylglycerol---prolipoprotein diacylglyceryl transferase
VGEEQQKEMINMTRRAAVRRHPAGDAAPRSAVVRSDKEARTSGGFTALLESVTQDILAVTYWFDPAPHSGSYPVTVRFSGHRVGMKGRFSSSDRFVQDETIEQVIPGSGPLSLTARVHGIHPGEWIVTAHMLGSAHPAHGLREQGNEIPAGSLGLAARFWRWWVPSAESATHVRTCPAPFARVPGIVPGIWGVMVALGIAVALALQALVISATHLAVGPWWAISLVAIVVGIVAAKGWFIVLHRREHRIEGWCIQGFITGAIVAAALLLMVLDVPTGAFLDAAAPGLLIAMTVGRVGCFFAGCCGGTPTASHWGMWSSDQRVGARRIPTQLLESALAGILGILALVGILGHGPAGGAFLVAGLAAYILGRQGLLHLRAEPRQTKLGGLITAALAALVLIVALVFLAW